MLAGTTYDETALSMTTRRELTEAVGERYRRSDRTEKRQILDEFIELTGDARANIAWP
jgi:hypothetical protein